MNSIDEINDKFYQGSLPDCLNFTLEQPDNFDWEKIKYNTFYKSFDYVENKFPPGYESIPGFDKVIEMCIPNVTPLEEMKARQLSKEAIETLEKKMKTNIYER
jgi:hypothetical protein